MGQVRVMFVGQGASGLAEDRIVNTFFFNELLTPATEDRVLECIDKVIDFYNGLGVAPSAQNNSVASYLSPWVGRAAQCIGYNMADAKPRTPVPVPFTLLPCKNDEGLPEEVAFVLSTRGDPPHTARRRGRVFLGPLVTGASNPGTSIAPARPQNNMRDDCLKALVRLTAPTAAGYRWSIHSSVPTENYVLITNGWIDNAFDTQRRRGPDASTRTPWEKLPE